MSVLVPHAILLRPDSWRWGASLFGSSCACPLRPWRQRLSTSRTKDPETCSPTRPRHCDPQSLHGDVMMALGLKGRPPPAFFHRCARVRCSIARLEEPPIGLEAACKASKHKWKNPQPIRSGSSAIRLADTEVLCSASDPWYLPSCSLPRGSSTCSCHVFVPRRPGNSRQVWGNQQAGPMPTLAGVTFKQPAGDMNNARTKSLAKQVSAARSLRCRACETDVIRPDKWSAEMSSRQRAWSEVA